MAWTRHLERLRGWLVGGGVGTARRERRVPFRLELLEDRAVPATVAASYSALMSGLQDPRAWGTIQANTTGALAVAAGGSVGGPMSGDFNNDGLSDVAVFRPESGTWVVGLSDRDSFDWNVWATNWAGGGVWRVMLAGDFTGDGRTDIAAMHESGEWWVARSTGTGFDSTRWSAPWVPFGPWRTFHVGDFDGDGIADVAAMDEAGWWWLGESSGSEFFVTAPTSQWSAGESWRGFLAGDFTGDGKDDIAALHASGEWWVARGHAFGFQTVRWMKRWVDTGNWAAHVVGDFDGDGKDDIAAFHNPGRWFVARSTGTGFQSLTWATNWAAAESWHTYQVGDFDGDGKDEVAAMHTSGEWWIIKANGTGSRHFRWTYPTLTPGGWFGGRAGDFNGDGNDDVLVQNAWGSLFVGLSTGPTVLFGAPYGGLYVVSPWHLQQVRLDPASFPAMVGRYKDAVRSALGPGFDGLTDDGVALVLASTMAYELAAYRGADDPEGTFPVPDAYSLSELMNAPKLVCTEYVMIAYRLYRIYRPAGSGPAVTLTREGWDPAPFGNHAQLMVKGVGVPLLLDPTSGIIAVTDLTSLKLGVPVPAGKIRLPSIRIESTRYMQAALSDFRRKVYDALVNGRYDEANHLYSADMDSEGPYR